MRNNVFIEIDKDTYLIWKDGYDSLESLANELFPIYLFAELSPRDFDPLSEYWLSLFRNLGDAEETTNRYFGIANGLISKFVDLLSDIRDYQLRQEIHNALIIVVNKFFELIHNKEKIARLNLLCFHQSMHLMWQYIDLSYSQNDQGRGTLRSGGAVQNVCRFQTLITYFGLLNQEKPTCCVMNYWMVSNMPIWRMLYQQSRLIMQQERLQMYCCSQCLSRLSMKQEEM